MRILFVLAMLLFANAAWAGDIATDTALLRGLDKTTGRTKTFSATVGKPTQFGELTVVVSKCMKRPIDEAPENSAFFNISETETGTEVFQGWMFSSNPALSAMEHPVYDIWVLECQNAADRLANVKRVDSNIEMETLDEAALAEIDD